MLLRFDEITEHLKKHEYQRLDASFDDCYATLTNDDVVTFQLPSANAWLTSMHRAARVDAVNFLHIMTLDDKFILRLKLTHFTTFTDRRS